VERTGRKEAEEEVARLRGALEKSREYVAFDAETNLCDGTDSCPYCFAVIQLGIIDAALHAQDTEVEE